MKNLKMNYVTLENRLLEYGKGETYPLHMPGHKRQKEIDYNLPVAIDITEIEGFDNLHNPKGILYEAEKRATEIYGVKRSYYLVNGSTSGVLSAISACNNEDDKILVARNCHKSVYNAAMLNKLNIEYIYPNFVSGTDIWGGLTEKDIPEKKYKSVVITSPSYEGVISNVKAIAEKVHSNGGLLIIDEAHGAHLKFLDEFPESAVECGADIVVQSAHKTLPSLTQTAFLHVCTDRVDIERLEFFLAIYQSSSPSYVLMSSLDKCVDYIINNRVAFSNYEKLLGKVRKELKNLKNFTLLEKQVGLDNIYEYDPGKLVIISNKKDIRGIDIAKKLRETYKLECEMAGPDYVIAMTSVMDTREGLYRLVNALKEMDKAVEIDCANKIIRPVRIPKAVVRTSIQKALNSSNTEIMLAEAKGRISCEFVYAYPPGSPILLPGEEITEDVLSLIDYYRAVSLEICGARRLEEGIIKVVN